MDAQQDVLLEDHARFTGYISKRGASVAVNMIRK